jgi:uncharacterized membrane protein
MDNPDQINNLLNSSTGIDTAGLGKMLIFITVVSLVLSIILLIFFIATAVRRYKVDNAILEIRDMLKSQHEQVDKNKATNVQGWPQKEESTLTEQQNINNI